jgi:integrase
MVDKKADEKKPTQKKHPEKALNAARIRKAKPGKYADGNGLYLKVDESGAKRWTLRTVIHGKRHELGLGGLNLVSLTEAREEAARLRRIARKNGDPLAERRQERRVVPTFEEAAREAHKSYSTVFKARHANRWLTTLETYAFPIFGNCPVNAIESNDILRALSPIWIAKAETARRVKQRMATVFTWCKAKGYVSGDNPTEGIEQALPKQNGKVQEHHPALPYTQVPEFVLAIQESKVAISIRLAFEFLILAAARTSEVIYAKWLEIDFENKTWIVPAERMKMKREHRVPLSARCIEILKAAKEIAMGGEYVFPGRKHGRALSNMVFLMALRRMERTDITAHGFRSSFRDWAEEKTTVQRSVIEAALAHQVESKVEAAYLRTTLFDKRRRLMDSWAAFALTKPSQKVVQMREAQ